MNCYSICVCVEVRWDNKVVGYTEVWKVGYMETPFTDYLGSL